MTVKLDKARALVAEHGAVDLELVGMDGNAFMVIGAISRAARHAGWPAEAVKALQDEMVSSGYDHLLQVAMVAVGDACPRCGANDGPHLAGCMAAARTKSKVGDLS